jgi:hypothetical protein
MYQNPQIFIIMIIYHYNFCNWISLESFYKKSYSKAIPSILFHIPIQTMTTRNSFKIWSFKDQLASTRWSHTVWPLATSSFHKLPI